MAWGGKGVWGNWVQLGVGIFFRSLCVVTFRPHITKCWEVGPFFQTHHIRLSLPESHFIHVNMGFPRASGV